VDLHYALKQHALGLKTVDNYLCETKKALILKGLIVNPLFHRTVRYSVIDKAREYDPKIGTEMLRKLAEFESLGKYDQYKIWRKIRPTKPAWGDDEVDVAIRNTDFFTADYMANWKLMSLEAYQQGSIKELREKATERLEKKLKGPKFIAEPQDFMKFILSGLHSKANVTAMLPALLFCCGRRPSSLYIQVDDFEVYDTDSNYCCYFTERLKKRSLRDVIRIKVPLLAPYGLFKACLNRFRGLIKAKYKRDLETVAEVNTKRNRIDNEHIRKRMGENWSMRDLRPMYVQFMLKVAGEYVQSNVFIKGVLGHQDIHHSLHYSAIMLQAEPIHFCEFDETRLEDDALVKTGIIQQSLHYTTVDTSVVTVSTTLGGELVDSKMIVLDGDKKAVMDPEDPLDMVMQKLQTKTTEDRRSLTESAKSDSTSSRLLSPQTIIKESLIPLLGSSA